MKINLWIYHLRQNRLYVAEENVNQLNLEFSLTLTEYYDSIDKSIDKKLGDARIPISLLWDTKGFNAELIYQKQKINDKSREKPQKKHFLIK